MAKNKTEQNYVIPLRREFQKAPRYKKAPKAMRAVREFISKHMKSDNVKIGKHLNEKVWKHGIKNPPSKIEVTAKKEKDYVTVELTNIPISKKQAKLNAEAQEKKPTKEELEKTMKKELEIDKKEQSQQPTKKEVPKAGDLKKETKDKTPKASELKEKKETKKDSKK